MTFAWPWLFLALPLPWLLQPWLEPAQGGAALRLPRLPDSGVAEAEGPGPALWLVILAWLLLVTAAARPQGPGESLPQANSGRSLLLAFDVSASMATPDLRVAGQAADRLKAARVFADDFLRRRQGDRVGLIVFGTQAYLHTPLTFDLEAVREALAGAEVGLAGRETALGDAIAMAAKHLQGGAGPDKVLVLLTDGANTAGTLEPRRAAWLARREGVRIHSVGIGNLQPGTDLDAETLRDIAERTGGTYQHVSDGAAMADFWRRLDSIEPLIQAGGGNLRPPRELYPWPLGLALALVAGLLLGRLRGRPA
jgi:Ca-activated chloride channel family protein